MKTDPSELTPRQVAELWNCSEKTVRRLIAAGDLPAVNLKQRATRIKRVDVDAFYATRSTYLSACVRYDSCNPWNPDSKPSPGVVGRPWGGDTSPVTNQTP